MNEYIVTIVPVVDDSFASPAVQTRVRLELEGGRPTVKEVVIQPVEGAEMRGGELPYVNLELLLSAFIPGAAGDRPGVSVTGGALPRVSTGAAEPARAEPASPTAGRSRKGGLSRKPSATARIQAGRAYRRAPQDDELEAVYRQTGTIAGVAGHFGVPAHTAQGWITRLRRKHSAATDS
ncbi:MULTISPECIES: hypothetical protein [unclassified Micromonospora]|jgi:hypothetical protein|uniref:hypothetical protein n=1 Tax=Micromonospora TaxID=1873 RepID=UPI00188E0D6C|nr:MULTISPECIES: hypothetical protein [unclassified Micromonospora]MBF5030009.1 hypothetical protein [Micromonospora sp. ANENR4]MCZ7474981.1 hypothetical protein [Micromonospora sp. WMMC273]WBC05602.1 hypothetical protein O7546_11775 [Micromonospora sp. WMMA1976]